MSRGWIGPKNTLPGSPTSELGALFFGLSVSVRAAMIEPWMLTLIEFQFRYVGGLLAQAADAPGGIEGLVRSPLFPMIFLGILFYIMLIRPERQRKQDHAQLVSNLKKHDRVVTIGGIYGQVASVQQGSPDVTLLIDESSSVKIRVQRSSISKVITDSKDGNAD
jgi:preprotein translocase subunit YajC